MTSNSRDTRVTLAQYRAQTCASPTDENPNEYRGFAESSKRDLYPSTAATPKLDDPLGEPIGIRQVARLLGCSVWTVRQRYVPQGLPHVRSSAAGRLVFFRTQVINWTLKRQQFHTKGGETR